MIKKICFIVACLAPFLSHAEESVENFIPIYSQENVLRNATDQYLHWINRISQGEVFPQMEAAAEILSPDCRKILNGQLFTETREDFVIDLLSFYANQGAWKITPADIIIDSTSRTVVLRLFIEMANSSTYTAIVILRYDSNHLITEINEVLNEVKGSYGFSMHSKPPEKRPNYFDFRTAN